MPDSDLHPALNQLQTQGVRFKFSKQGSALVADFRDAARPIADADLACVAEWRNLRELYLDGAAVTDLGLKQVAGLAKLATLDLQNTLVTDAGLESLCSLPSLKLLLLTGSQVTRAGVGRLRKSMLKTRIVFL